MYHSVYCIENLVNGKVYVGKHSTENLDDGYMGSGKRISNAIAKHGLENFRKFIIAELDSSEKALEFEKLLVTEEFVSDENTYNLNVGGRGSFLAANEFYRNNPSIKKEAATVACKARWSKPLAKLHAFEQMSKRHQKHKESGLGFEYFHCDWTGKRHNDETKRKIGAANSVHQSGEKNSQFGTCWVSHPELKKSQRVNKDEVERYLANGWVKGRKMKW